jgi:hypothetical protein
MALCLVLVIADYRLGSRTRVVATDAWAQIKNSDNFPKAVFLWAHTEAVVSRVSRLRVGTRSWKRFAAHLSSKCALTEKPGAGPSFAAKPRAFERTTVFAMR